MPPLENLAVIKSTAERILSHPTWDIITLFLLVAIGFFYGMAAGRRKIISTIIYTYVAYAVFPVIPFEKIAGFAPTAKLFFLKIGVFVAIFLLLVFLLGRTGGRAFASSNPIWQVFLLSFVQAGLLIHLIVSFLPPDQIKLLAPVTKNFFANPDLHIWWLLGPLVVLIFIRRFEVREETKW